MCRMLVDNDQLAVCISGGNVCSANLPENFRHIYCGFVFSRSFRSSQLNLRLSGGRARRFSLREIRDNRLMQTPLRRWSGRFFLRHSRLFIYGLDRSRFISREQFLLCRLSGRDCREENIIMQCSIDCIANRRTYLPFTGETHLTFGRMHIHIDLTRVKRDIQKCRRIHSLGKQCSVSFADCPLQRL